MSTAIKTSVCIFVPIPNIPLSSLNIYSSFSSRVVIRSSVIDQFCLTWIALSSSASVLALSICDPTAVTSYLVLTTRESSTVLSLRWYDAPRGYGLDRYSGRVVEKNLGNARLKRGRRLGTQAQMMPMLSSPLDHAWAGGPSYMMSVETLEACKDRNLSMAVMQPLSKLA